MKKLLPLLVLILCFASCRKHNADIPRRYAFPRIESYDTAMVLATVGGVSFEINAAADTTMPRTTWLDISYPRYNATVHIAVNSFKDEQDFLAALDNRSHRMELNFGDTRIDAETFLNDYGYICTLAGSPEAGSAPIFFIASDSALHLVSGATVFSGNTLPVDSIRPVFNDLYRDITKLLQSLR